MEIFKTVIKKHHIQLFLVITLASLVSISCQRILNTSDLPGDKKKFEPVAAISKVTEFVESGEPMNAFYENCGKQYLLGIEARYIKPDGTMDLEADYEPVTIYSFISKTVTGKPKEKPKKEQPSGLGQAQTKRPLKPSEKYGSKRVSG